MGRWLLSACLGLMLGFWGDLPQARAQAQGGFTSNNYSIDLFTGPVVAGGRIRGMAGAYAAIASGIDGSVFNPAGYAERVESEINWWEWELTGSLSLGGIFHDNDFDNNGHDDLSSADAFSVGLGGRMQFGHVGTGLSAVAQTFTLKDASDKAFADVVLTNLRAGGGYAFLDGDLVVGATLRGVILQVDSPTGAQQTLVNFFGLGAEFGVLARPAHERYRAGLAVRTPIESRPNNSGEVVNGLRTAQGLVLPERVHVPWELDLGFAYQFGERRTNVPWRETTGIRTNLQRQLANGTYLPPPLYDGPAYTPIPHDNPKAALRQAIANDREAERRLIRNQPRRYVLVSGDLILYGKTDRGQGLTSFLTQQPETSGAKNSVGVRFGMESEVLQNRMKVRAGTYLEPSRFQRSYYRPHGTLGFDVRLFDLWRWSFRGTATIDAAPRFFDWGAAIGIWR
ncbi:MAG: hypothetical protein QM778_14020 [Myxococcales bacterium]